MTGAGRFRRKLRATRPEPHTARVVVRGRYEPDTIVADAGRSLRVTFRREDTLACSERVVFPDFGKSAMLPPHRDVTVELGPARAGEYEFTCQEGLLRGRLIVTDWGLGHDAKCGSETVSELTAADALGGEAPPRSAIARLWSAILALWGGLMGLLPHVLHHAGPLAGAALLAGAGGRLLFAVIGLIAAIPFLRRLRRRFATWRAPALALAVFAAMFAFSSFVIGPVIAGGAGEQVKPGIEQPAGHAQHH